MGMVCDHILGTVGDPPDNGGQPFSDQWVTKFWMLGDPLGDGGDQPGDGW